MISNKGCGKLSRPGKWTIGRSDSIPDRWEASKMSDIDKAVEETERGKTWEETDEVVEVEVKKPLDHVIPVRLSADKWEEIRAEARELGIGPSTLLRMWVLERLRQKVRS